VVSRDIRRILTDRAFYFGILLDDVSITHLTFSKLYEASIEAKQVAQQEAERAKFVVDKALQEKQSAIVRAQVRRAHGLPVHVNPGCSGKLPEQRKGWLRPVSMLTCFRTHVTAHAVLLDMQVQEQPQVSY
jgi:hypothetical protein